MFFMPETPRWYLSRNRRSEAMRVLLWFGGPDADIEEECTAIEATLGRRSRQLLYLLGLHSKE